MSKKKHQEEEQAKNAAAARAEQDLPETREEPVEVPAQEEVQTPPQPDYYERFVRLSADFDNYRKRTEREKASFLSYGKKQFAEKLLPAYEVMLREREKMSKEQAEAECEGELKSLRDGMRLILGELEKAFTAEGVTRMDVLDKPYNPDTQEVVAMVPSSAEQAGLVLQEVQMGFMMDGKVLRPARVIVGQESED